MAYSEKHIFRVVRNCSRGVWTKVPSCKYDRNFCVCVRHLNEKIQTLEFDPRTVRMGATALNHRMCLNGNVCVCVRVRGCAGGCVFWITYRKENADGSNAPWCCVTRKYGFDPFCPRRPWLLSTRHESFRSQRGRFLPPFSFCWGRCAYGVSLRLPPHYENLKFLKYFNLTWYDHHATVGHSTLLCLNFLS
jgi:hypothetical protein